MLSKHSSKRFLEHLLERSGKRNSASHNLGVNQFKRALHRRGKGFSGSSRLVLVTAFAVSVGLLTASPSVADTLTTTLPSNVIITQPTVIPFAITTSLEVCDVYSWNGGPVWKTPNGYEWVLFEPSVVSLGVVPLSFTK